MPEPGPWLARFGDLNVASDSIKGRAPHKPLLLLAVLSLVEDGLLVSPSLTLSPELVRRFRDLWPIVLNRRGNRGDIRMPFHALGSTYDRVWQVCDCDGRASLSSDTTTFAILPDDLLALFADPTFRTALRRLLVGTYFPPLEQVELAAHLGFEHEIDETELAGYRVQREAFREAKKRGRSARFKCKVPSAYTYTCALTGYRLTLEGGTQRELIEAAHIHQHAKSGNDDLDNGLALTPTAHALFDMGLWSATDDLRVLVKPAAVFTETGSAEAFSLRALSGRPLTLPSITRLRPHPDHLRWHRHQHGFA
jgi:putative restriction endonuclease